jgi:AcrR family transcriptional regulator
VATPDPRIDTKHRLLDAAERLFAEHGFAATSLRAITAAAEANLAAVNYHFGSKEGIVRAVFDRRLGPLNAERLGMLDDCEHAATPDPPPLDCVLRAMALPWAREVRLSSASGFPFVRLLGRAHFEPDPALRRLIVESFREVSRRFIAALGRCLPQLSQRELHSRFFFAVGALTVIADLPMFSSFAADQAATGEPPDVEPVVEHMIGFLRAGLLAPPVDGPASLRPGPEGRS